MIVSVLYIFLGIVLVLIPTKIFPVCDSEKMKMACYYTKQAEIGLGLLVTLLGIISTVFKNSNVRLGISLSQLGAAILVFLYPIKLIGYVR